MTLNATNLRNEIKAAVLATEFGVDDPMLDTIWDAIAGAVVTHIQANAVVTVAAGQTVLTPDTINGTTTTPGTGTIA